MSKKRGDFTPVGIQANGVNIESRDAIMASVRGVDDVTRRKDGNLCAGVAAGVVCRGRRYDVDRIQATAFPIKPIGGYA